MMTHTCNPSTCEVEAGGSGVQSQPWIHETLSMNKGREGQRKKEKKGKNTAPIHTSSHVSKIHVLWLKSQEPGYYAKKACILESHQLESSGQVKPMCPPVVNDNYPLKDALRENTFRIFILSQVCDQMECCWVGSHGSMDIAESIRTMRQWGEESLHGRDCFSPSSPPWMIPMPQLIALCWSTSLSNCLQHQEDQGGKVSREYTMLAGSLHICVVLGSALTSPCKTYRWFSWHICLSTFP